MVAINGTELCLWEWGDPQARPVLCAHGAFDHGRMWDELAPQVAALGYRVVAVDGRGHGNSGRLPHGMTFRAGVLDLGMLMLELGPPVGLIGHSMGGGQVLGAAATWPEDVAWVINIDGLGPPDDFPLEPLGEVAANSVAHAEKTMRRGSRPFASLSDMAGQRGAINTRLPAEWLEHLVAHGSVEKRTGPGDETGEGQGTVSYYWKWDPLFNVGMPTGFSPETATADLPHLEAPTLVLTGGEHDMWSEMSASEVAARVSLVNDVEHHVVAGGGHYLHLEQPEQTIELMQDFLARRESRRP